MSNTPVQDHPQDHPAQRLSSGSGQTLPSRPIQPGSDPSASKRVCFYKSGDYKFSGHRMVISARTFKTFDALLDALSKKVPLPFGVRTITTPRGTHLVKGLDDLQDGGAYVCSDQKRVKPLNLDEVNRRQVPWNTTRPLSARRRRQKGLSFGPFGRNSEAATRPPKVMERAAVRTPKRLVVIKNRDPTVKRTIVLQRRTAPTFDALLDYLSQILQFPVLKLYSTDGRRVDGLAALILCSGVVVAAGNEPFRLGNYSLYRTSQMAQAMLIETVEQPMQPRAQKNKSFSSGRGSRNFSLSSERYIVNQINKSQSGSMNGHLRHHNRSFETEINQPHTSMERCETGRADNEHHTCIVPDDDDIEKSFRVNQDGSMTVEMKVRLTIKEEEMLHWTTTLSRSSLSKRTVCASVSGSGNSSPDSNNAIAKDSSSITEDETKEENYSAGAGKAVGFNNERAYDGYTTGKSKTSFKRTPTPGPRHVNKKASVESVKTVTESGVQESLLGHYSYMERTADGETTEGYCVVRHSSSSNRPIPKPRKTPSAGTSNKCSNSSIKSSGVAEVLQIQNNGMEVTETVMHIYESQGCYDNYFANEEYSADGDPLHGSTPAPESKPSSGSGSNLSSNDCDIDGSWQPPTADSLQRQKEEMLSLSSEPRSVTQEITNDLSSLTEKEAQTATNTDNQETVKKDAKGIKKKIIRPARNQKSSTSTSSTDRKTKESTISPSKTGKHSSTEKISSDASMGRKVSSENANVGQKSNRAENSQSKKSLKEEKMPKKDSGLSVSSENVKRTPPKRQSFNKAASDHNVKTPTGRPQMKKNMSDILQTKKTPLPGKKTISKPRSVIENRISPPPKSSNLSESVSMPSFNPSPSEIHQYVENWLEKVSPDAVPYSEEVSEDRTEPRTKVVFKIGADSESEEKSECPTYLDECYPTTSDPMKKSSSCLSVPHSYGGPATAQLHSEQKARGLCASMPSVRVDAAHQESTLRSHKSAEAIGPADDQPSSYNILSPKAKLTPVVRQLCSSIHCIRTASDTNNQQTTSNLEKSSSLPDFPTQVASVFGSSCKAFLSFLSVMTLRDSLKSPVLGESSQSGSTSEAMLMMESLQKMSAIEDAEEQRASLTDLQSRASSQFRERWKNFQILRERLESEPLSPKVSETEFALDVVSESGDVFEDQNMVIDELMEELNMPQELRAEITSTIQQAFYPVEESTFLETDRNQSESEEDVEQFVKEDEACTSDDITETKQSNDDAEIEPEPPQELQTEFEVPVNDEELKTEENAGVVEECGETKETDADGEGHEGKGESEREKEAVEDEITNDEECEPGEGSDKESVEKVAEVAEDEVTADDEEQLAERLEEKADKTEEGLVSEQEREVDSVEETDEREGAEETEEDEEMKGITEERESSEEKETEKKEIRKKVEDDNMEETGEEENIDDINEEAEEEEEPEEEEEESEEGEEEGEENEIETISPEMEEEEEGKEEEGGEEGEENEIETISQEMEEEEEGEEECVVAQKDVQEVNEEEEEGEEINEEDEEKEIEEQIMEVDSDEAVKENEDEEDGEDVEDKNAEEKRAGVARDEEEEESDEDIEAENNSEEEESGEEEKVTGLCIDDEEERDNDEELNEVGEDSKDEAEEGRVDEGSVSDESEHMLEEASYLQQQVSSCEAANGEHDSESPSKLSSEGQCADDKGNGTELETENEGAEQCEESSNSMSHPVEISQELLDFVNHALQSSSLIFTYDTQGNIRIEPDYARFIQTKQTMISKSRKDSSYGLKRLPSPSTSDLSDYRPETSESGGYKTQDSLDIITESGEEVSEKTSQSAHRTNVAKSAGSSSSSDSGTKASKDLSYFSAASSLKADAEAAAQPARCTSAASENDLADGVLIDKGRWLLKENHLIRKSPPVSQGMYSHVDTTSVDTGQENTSEESPPHFKIQPSPLAAISSSELEEMAKPLTPKCTYYNMPHGSDSDPFMDDSSFRSGKKDSSRRGVRVSPTVDTSKTWANKNGSLSSFASVEFKIPTDRKVHPEGEPSSTVTQPRRTSSGRGSALQSQDSLDALHVRCGQYCPIL
ncbi:oxygen-regulated protein 1 [Parambassis ranga]|uniref:Oxygen-regulated protein 1 n=1 Tax=Parambassis ranga TaxID=210632 RepID=A0A6P7K252_9TELE|nr:oxygen-regulated protein 1 [Parambassis ranga]